MPSISAGRGRRVVRIEIAETAITGQHVRPALLDGLIVAIPFDFAGADLDHRAPRCVAGQSVAGRGVQQEQSRRAAENRNDPRHSSDLAAGAEIPAHWDSAAIGCIPGGVAALVTLFTQG